MSFKIEGVNLQRRQSNEAKLCCESCQNGQTDIYICDLCFLFCCSTCSKNHMCLRQTLESSCKFMKVQTDSQRPLQLCRKVSEGGNPRFGDFFGVKNQWNRSCMRCYITTATKSCIKCRLKYYCDHCFKSIHFQTKLSNHEFTEILQNKDKLKTTLFFNFSSTSKDQKMTQKDRIAQSDIVQFSDIKGKDLKTLEQSLNLIKNQLLRQYNNHQVDTNQSISCVSKYFGNLVEEAKLKELQIILKIQQTAKNITQRYDQIKKSINLQERCLSNIVQLYKNDQSLIPNEIVKGKQQLCQRQINNLINFAEISSIRENTDKKYPQISDEIDQICLKISQIQLKRFFLNIGKMDSRKLSYASINTSRNDKSTNSQKTPLDVPYNKSNDKLSFLTMSLITPKKSQQIAKSYKNLQNGVTKSLFVSENVLHSPENQTQRSLEETKILNFGSKKNLELKKIQSQKEKKILPGSLLSPKTSIKKFDRCPETITKSKMIKTGKNIEKTKKMITQIRNEMIEFTNRYNCEKEASQMSERQMHFIDVSQLSIQSFVDKSNKL